MAQLQILTQFSQLFNQVKQSLDNYNENLKNDLFEIEEDESNEDNYQKGETIFDQCENDVKNIEDILEKENEIVTFFSKCRENHQKLILKKNTMINQLLRIKKKQIKSKEELIRWKEDWNKKRKESPDERNRRECEEMLEEMKDREIMMNEMMKNIQREQENLKKEKEEMMNNLKEEHEKLHLKKDKDKVSDSKKKAAEEKNEKATVKKVATKSAAETRDANDSGIAGVKKKVAKTSDRELKGREDDK